MAIGRTTKPRVKESSVRVKKRVKRGVKKGMKRVKSAPPEAYLAGAGLVGGTAAVLLLATTKRGQELLVRAAQLVLQPDAEEDQESEVEEDVQKEPAKGAERKQPAKDSERKQPAKDSERKQPAKDAERKQPAKDAEAAEEVDEDTNGDEESEVRDLKPREQRPDSHRKAPAPQKATTA
jgi:hypothetical protein